MQFFFQVILRHGEPPSTFALVSRFGPRNPDLWDKSFGTVWSCEYNGDNDLVVVDVKTILSVVAIVPHPDLEKDVPENCAGRFYIAEKLGLDVAITDSEFDVTLDSQ